MESREFKDLIFQQFANIGSAFSSPKRLEIIDLLAQNEKDVETLAKGVSISVANASRHLQLLKNAKFVETRREGVHIYYRLSDSKVFECYKNLQTLAGSRVAEIRELVRQFYEEREALSAMTNEELLSHLRNNDVTVLDVRPEDEYQSNHIQGAISIPLSKLEKRLDELPADKEIVAYCRGPYCVLSPEAVKILNQAGYKVSRLQEGMPEWKNLGLPVE